MALAGAQVDICKDIQTTCGSLWEEIRNLEVSE